MLSRAELKFASDAPGCEDKPANMQQEAGKWCLRGFSHIHKALNPQMKTGGCNVLKATQLVRAGQAEHTAALC